MAFPLISTKLHIPPLPRAFVPRPQLVARLQAGAPSKLVLVSAPAGFGKSSLIAEWAIACSQECLVSWIHLDDGDNELTRFVSYIIAALQIHQKDLGEAALSGMLSTPPPPIEAIMASLINEIGSLAAKIILVLDDYHLIDTPAIHAAVDFLIEHFPPNISLVIATRTDPPFPIHRLRARDQMIEIRADDLRFSNEEMSSFLEKTLDYRISADDIAVLDSRIEGWIAGLQMVALSVQCRKDIHEFIENFSGSHRYIMDYLTEEIYNLQPLHIQTFLLKTSILDRLSGRLCEEVLGLGFASQEIRGEILPAQAILEHLEHANLFLNPLDDERHWYRYHHLFANLLEQRLRKTYPDEIHGLYQRASLWCDANGYFDEAFKYAFSANDVQLAAQIVENHALDYLKTGTLPTLLGWLNKLPDEIVKDRPWLCVFCAWTLLLTGRLDCIEPYLVAAGEKLSTAQDPEDLNGHIVAIQAYMSMLRGDVDRAVVLAQKALDLLPEGDLTVRCVVAFVLGGANYMRNDVPAAIESMMDASRIGMEAGNIHLAVSAMSSVGSFLRSQGKLTEAEEIYSQALKLGTGRSGRPLPIAAGVYSGQAEIYLARNDLKKAHQYATTGLELARQWGNVDTLAGSYLALANVSLLEGNFEEAQLAIDEAKRLAADHNLTPGYEDRIAAIEALAVQPQMGARDQGLIEPLTERELELLKLMAEGRSNPEIAAELIIALGTVKAHTSSIYRKLDVRSRTQAVIRARELGLL